MSRPSFAGRRSATGYTVVIVAFVSFLQIDRSPALPAPAPSSSTQILSFGHNGTGQGGLGTNTSSTPVATRIDMSNLAGKSLIQAAAGDIHSLLLASDGSVYSFGSNYPYGQTGLNTNSSFTAIATPIVGTNLAGRRIVQIAAGGEHSLLLADDGTVFSFGDDSDGQTGLGPEHQYGTLIATPIVTTNLSGKRIKQVAAGFEHSLLLAEDGTVFSFGGNKRGRTGLGIGTPNNTHIATPIDTTNLVGKTIIQVAAGGEHSVLLADDGTVFTFGSNSLGQTGLGTTAGDTVIATAIDTSNLAGKIVVQVDAGADHNLLLTEDGNVYSFGWNFYGHTGLGTTMGSTPVAVPIDNRNLAGHTIRQVVAGGQHSLLLADDGTIFAFGWNESARTGLGTDVGNTPIAVPILRTNLANHSVFALASGTRHSLLLAVTIPEPGAASLVLLAGLPLAFLIRFRKETVTRLCDRCRRRLA